MNKVKVLITDDSVVYRSQIKAALSTLDWIEVVGVASNGRLAIEKLQQTPVDLLILDLEMPEMNGLQTLQEISNKGIKCKVLVFSSASKRGAEITMDALRLGATDFIAKPGFTEGSAMMPPNEVIRALLEPKLNAIFQDPQGQQPKVMAHVEFSPMLWEIFNPDIVLIGSSTGGPTMLEKIFSEIKGPLRCPILITQHMPPIFTATLAERIQKLCGISCVEGKHGMDVLANHIYMAPGDFHMTITGSKQSAKICLDQGPLVNSVRPAVDPMFDSAAKVYGQKCLGIVLTGMGADGCVGAAKVKAAGGSILIQSEKSCVVFGMPGAVMAAGAFDKILDPPELIRALQEKAMSFSPASLDRSA